MTMLRLAVTTLLAFSVGYCQSPESLLFDALSARNEATATALLNSGAKLDARDKDGLTYLHAAARLCMEKTTSLLLDRGLDPNLTDKDHYAPLHYASSCSAKLPEMLVAKGANVNAKNENGTTPLMIAASRGNDDVVKFLLSKGADPKLQDKDGKTAASKAAMSGKPSTVDMLRKAINSSK